MSGQNDLDNTFINNSIPNNTFNYRGFMENQHNIRESSPAILETLNKGGMRLDYTGNQIDDTLFTQRVRFLYQMDIFHFYPNLGLENWEYVGPAWSDAINQAMDLICFGMGREAVTVLEKVNNNDQSLAQLILSYLYTHASRYLNSADDPARGDRYLNEAASAGFHPAMYCWVKKHLKDKTPWNPQTDATMRSYLLTIWKATAKEMRLCTEEQHYIDNNYSATSMQRFRNNQRHMFDQLLTHNLTDAFIDYLLHSNSHELFSTEYDRLLCWDAASCYLEAHMNKNDVPSDVIKKVKDIQLGAKNVQDWCPEYLNDYEANRQRTFKELDKWEKKTQRENFICEVLMILGITCYFLHIRPGFPFLSWLPEPTFLGVINRIPIVGGLILDKFGVYGLAGLLLIPVARFFHSSLSDMEDNKLGTVTIIYGLVLSACGIYLSCTEMYSVDPNVVLVAIAEILQYVVALIPIGLCMLPGYYWRYVHLT